MASKKQKELLEFLGTEYSIKGFDGEPCLYRKINAQYDIEITGTYRKNRPIHVYVWDISNGVHTSAHIVEEHVDISDRSALKALLDELTKKYQIPYRKSDRPEIKGNS